MGLCDWNGFIFCIWGGESGLDTSTQNQFVFAGSYAPPEQDAIHVLRFDGKDGVLERIGGVNGIENATFLAIDPSRRLVFAVSETETDSMAVSYSFDPAEGNLKEISRQPTYGGYACHLQLHPSGKWLLAVNYLNGSAVCVYPVAEGGALGPAACRVEHTGRGVREDRQERAHPHSVFRVPGRDDRYLVPDLGTDTVYAYAFDALSGRLQLLSENRQFAGGGPRHLTYHPTLPLVYVIHELGASVTVHELDAESGVMRQLQRLSTLPEGRSPDEFAAGEICAEIVVSESGEFLYGSNRQHDTIAVFRIGPDGLLAPVGHAPSGGSFPRNFCLVEGGRHLLAANQKSDRISVHSIGSDGVPVLTGAHCEVTRPAFVKAIPARDFTV